MIATPKDLRDMAFGIVKRSPAQMRLEDVDPRRMSAPAKAFGGLRDVAKTVVGRATANMPGVQPVAPTAPYGIGTRELAEMQLSIPQVADVFGSDYRPQSAQVGPVNAFADLYSQLTRAPGGLTPKGKYGGFYTAGDLEEAVRGSTFNFMEQVPTRLRETANTRLGELQGLSDEARLDAQRKTTSGVMTPLPPVREGYDYQPGSYVEQTVNPYRQYTNELATWYAGQAKPAEEYLTAAQQIEMSRPSDLAQAIAVRAYGMNPDLATAKFMNMDEMYAQRQRDNDYLDRYGMTEAQYSSFLTAQEKERSLGTAEENRQAKDFIASYTNLDPSNLSSMIGRTPTQVANILAAEGMTYKDPKTGQEVRGNAGDIASQVAMMINSNDLDAAQRIFESVISYQNQMPLASIIAAMLKVGGRTNDAINKLVLSGYLAP